MHDMPSIVEAVLQGYALSAQCDHGVTHWARVLENGLRVADATRADHEVVRLFAVFHDSRRVNEARDDGHGLRGAEFARSLRGTLIHLDDARFELLFEACRLHTEGLTRGDRTLQACWDADRLDLARVGIDPKPKLLCTDIARKLLPWANARAAGQQVPAGILASWRF